MQYFCCVLSISCCVAQSHFHSLLEGWQHQALLRCSCLSRGSCCSRPQTVLSVLRTLHHSLCTIGGGGTWQITSSDYKLCADSVGRHASRMRSAIFGCGAPPETGAMKAGTSTAATPTGAASSATCHQISQCSSGSGGPSIHQSPLASSQVL